MTSKRWPRQILSWFWTRVGSSSVEGIASSWPGAASTASSTSLRWGGTRRGLVRRRRQKLCRCMRSVSSVVDQKRGREDTRHEGEPLKEKVSAAQQGTESRHAGSVVVPRDARPALRARKRSRHRSNPPFGRSEVLFGGGCNG